MVSFSFIYSNPGLVRFIIRDNGIGMAESSHNLIFEKFYREPEKTGSNNPQGLGLGLYIVRKFVDLLKGQIHVQSAPGQGTEIQVDIPVKENDTIDISANKRLIRMNINYSIC
jgi:signal transduction histidine kinase